MKRQAQVITDAEMSLQEARRIRTRRYLIMMSLRIVILLLCGLLVALHVPLLGLWLLLGVIVVAAMPWMTVLLANDRLMTRKMKRVKKERRRAQAVSRQSPRSLDSDLGIALATLELKLNRVLERG
ncbi:DUF3099 domain-containing protein [Haloglycomyces albus]|uniref:DUF3099 domain-containing protein n=1 Tax=Haloglycomyces albus TaxID=526067 RepID=UPI00046CAECB|nr:DUF3099 domain-containing protein [Haloglycomyces albus]